MHWELLKSALRQDPAGRNTGMSDSTADLQIKGIAYDSRHVRPGYVFVAIPGRHHDGAAFVEEAITRGASAVIAESPVSVPRQVSFLRVPDAREALANISGVFYDHPSRRLDLIGITGTNGKTSTSFMAKAILERAGRAPGLVGSVCYEFGGRSIPAARTTPEAPDLNAMLDQMLRAGCRSAVMEVSSHALHQKRVEGLAFDVAVFTNLTRDHLEYHGTMEDYAEAKALLFDQLDEGARAVLNVDDPFGRRLAGRTDWRAERISYGLADDAAVRAEDVRLNARGSEFRAVSPWGTARVRLHLPGRYNVSNALAALTACGCMGVDLETMVQALDGVPMVRGRMEPVPNRLGFQVFVDYAHTDDALLNVLKMVREITTGRILLVFGCGGDRDRGKRPQMGAVAARYADHSYVTSDNPRGEDPQGIIREIAEGFGGAAHYSEIPDRKNAIEQALEDARPGDTVLIAGKGHENYQEFSHTVIPFDDVEVARRIMEEK